MKNSFNEKTKEILKHVIFMRDWESCEIFYDQNYEDLNENSIYPQTLFLEDGRDDCLRLSICVALEPDYSVSYERVHVSYLSMLNDESLNRNYFIKIEDINWEVDKYINRRT